MMVICGLSILGSLVDLAFRMVGDLAPFVPPEQAEFAQLGNVGGMVIDILFVFRDIFLIFAATRMLAGSSYSLAFAGAVIAVIPCVGSPCCILGIPFGIWALVVLNDPAVKAAFR